MPEEKSGCHVERKVDATVVNRGHVSCQSDMITVDVVDWLSHPWVGKPGCS